MTVEISEYSPLDVQVQILQKQNLRFHLMQLYLFERAQDLNGWVNYLRSNIHEFEKEELHHIFSFLQLHTNIFEEVCSSPQILNPLLERIHRHFDSFTTDERHELFETFFSGDYRNNLLYDRLANKEIHEIPSLNSAQLLRSISLFAKNRLPPQMLTNYITRLSALGNNIGDLHYFHSLHQLLKHSGLPPINPTVAFFFLQNFIARLQYVNPDVLPAGCTLQSIIPILFSYQNIPVAFASLSEIFADKSHLF